MTRRLCASILLGAAAWTASVGTAFAEAPAVVASINPVHSLVAGVMEGVGAPTLLVRGGGSPHSHSLRPSDAQALQDADVVFWVGEGLETVLARPLATLPRQARVVALHEADGITLLPFRDGGDWQKPAHADREDARDDGHAAGAYDLHVWLDPRNAGAMVDAIVAALSASDPANATRYRANGTALKARLAELDARLWRDLAPVQGRAYIVFHDAYQYFETRYRLTPAGSITVNADRSPGAQRLVEIRRKIAASGAACVFAEPQFEPALVDTVLEGSGARAAVLDPLGAELEPGPDAYFKLMRNLAGSLKGCLEPSS